MPGWGDESCPGPPDPTVFKPHGIDVGEGPDGSVALAVVNHGGREAVEFFEIGGGRKPWIEWRGCVEMPDDIMTNDVAFLPGGGFVVTNFMPAFDGLGPKVIWSVLKISVGAPTGSVLRWEPGGELTEIENSQGSAPNGIEVSADGTEIFVAEWGGGSVYRLRFDEEGPPRRDEVAVDHSPDNLTWTRDGRLLVAGQEGGIMASLGCGSIRQGGCDLGYSVYLLGPVGLEATKIVEGRGAASVALEVGDEIFVGAFVGDQIMRVRRPD
jgi:sugar lactone lactonase YvrE